MYIHFQIESWSISSTEQQRDSDSNKPRITVVASLLFPLFPSCCLDAPFVKPNICNRPLLQRSEQTNHRSFSWHVHHFLIQSNVLQHVHNGPASTHNIPLMEIIGTINQIKLWKGLDVTSQKGTVTQSLIKIYSMKLKSHQSKAPVPARHLRCLVVHLPTTLNGNRDSNSRVYESIGE